MVKNTLVWFTILFLLITGGCGKRQNIVPKSNLPAAEQEEIRSLLQDVDYMDKAARLLFAKKYEKKGVPFMIERIMEIYKLGSDWKHQRLYAQAENLIYSLGEIKDSRALPALKLWLIDEKYRVFRDEAAYAVGELGNPEAIEFLWNVWEEEKGYLEKGDDKGPWPFAGYHPAGGYVHAMLRDIAQALFKLGEKKVAGELVKVAKISSGRWSSGYMRIDDALTEISGGSGLFHSIDYWEKWWQRNKSKYQ